MDNTKIIEQRLLPNSDIIERITQAADRVQKLIDHSKKEEANNIHIKTLLRADKDKLYELEKGRRDKSSNAYETVSTTAHLLLVPQIIMGDIIESEEAHTVAANYFAPVRLPAKTAQKSITYPIIGTFRAGEVPEGNAYPTATLDVSKATAREVRVRKIGLQLNFTDEAISDSAWDIIRVYTAEAGKAMARYKEYWAFKEFSTFGHTVFDNDLDDPDALTTGRNQLGNLNNTVSFQDIMDVFQAMYLNGTTLTDLLIHPLLWFSWQQSAIYGGFSYNDPGSDSSKDATPFSFDIASKLPHKPKLVLAPELPFDYHTFKTDLYALDASKVGINLIKEDLSTEGFDDPTKDIFAYKVRERYALAVVNEGRGIATARNVVAEPSWPYKILLTNEV